MVEGFKLLICLFGQIFDDYGLVDGVMLFLLLLCVSDVYCCVQVQCCQWQVILSLGDEVVWVDVWYQWQQQCWVGSCSVCLLFMLYVYVVVVLWWFIDLCYQWIVLCLLYQWVVVVGVFWWVILDQDLVLVLLVLLLFIVVCLLVGQLLDVVQEWLLWQCYVMQLVYWNFDVLGDMVLLYVVDEVVCELFYWFGLGLFYVNWLIEDGQCVVLVNV